MLTIHRPYPTTFTKPSHSTADHGEEIEIPVWASKKLDYEGELALVIAKDCKNVKEDDALDYVLGYTATNDVSARDWQRDPELGMHSILTHQWECSSDPAQPAKFRNGTLASPWTSLLLSVLF